MSIPNLFSVKATMPVFTVVLARIILKERCSMRVYLSLTPIILGIFIATTTEFDFDMQGLLSSLLSTGIFAYLNILAKQVH
jgi:solute carrier family 35 protein E1